MFRLALGIALAACCFGAGGSYTITGWNDLGMHCMDGDYSVYAILPPYNTIHAQIVDPTGKLLTNPAGITVTYETIADRTGSVNQSSIGKTNFWQYAKSLFGGAEAPDMGLTGGKMPGAGNQAQAMQWEATQNWFTGAAIPITPFDDNGNKNYYPMMRLTARDSAGKELAHTDIVLPVSDEMDCSACHSSGSNAAATPQAGWVNQGPGQRDYKLNILLKHDDMEYGGQAYRNALQAAGYSSLGLYVTAAWDGQPVLCAACHASNALGTSGQPGAQALTAAVHMLHASQIDPVTGATLDAASNRGACYRCHPGSETRCLRSAMGNAAAPDGSLAIQCQSCHGNMSAVGDASRKGWLDEPNCQSCHTGGAATTGGNPPFTSVFDAAGATRTTADRTFATQANAPAAGLSLYRFSAGHGGLQCEGCHGSTHAEFPTSHANDNVQSDAIQGYAGFLGECTACHSSPAPGLGGPHGMHPVGQNWVSQHPDFAEHNTSQCTACHGTDYKGTSLSRAFTVRSLNAFGAKQMWRDYQIGCYTCHSGPNSESANRGAAPTVANASLATGAGVAASIQIATTAPNNNTLTLWVATPPANGTVGMNGATATYVPAPGFEGSDTFGVGAFDRATGLSSNLGTVQVQVTAATRPQVAAVVNAASFLPGATAPGEVFSIFGAGLGDAQPQGMFVNSAGLVNRSLGGTRVLFDGAPAPVLYSSPGQVNAVAPWSLSGKSSANIQVEYGGIKSASVAAAVAVSDPAIFPEAVLNADGSVNSASNPAARGSMLSLFITGAGAFGAAPFDGAFGSNPLSTLPAGSVTARIGSQDAAVTYAGDALGLISGVELVQVQIPAAAQAGSLQLTLSVNGAAAPPVTVAVK